MIGLEPDPLRDLGAILQIMWAFVWPVLIIFGPIALVALGDAP